MNLCEKGHTKLLSRVSPSRFRTWPHCGLDTALGLNAASLGEWPGGTLLPYLVGIGTNCSFLSLSLSEGEAHKQMKMKMGSVSYIMNVCVCVVWVGWRWGLSVVRQEASESLNVRENVSDISLPINLLPHGLHPIRALDSVQSMASRTGTSPGTT